ncbi:MAG: thiol peroxidase, partial [Bacteroidales bacterium]
MKRNSNLVTMGGKPVTLVGKLAKPGINAKNFLAVRSDNTAFHLSDYSGKVRIISSAASVDTDVCAEQTRRFNLEASKLGNVQVIAISCDLPPALKRFCAAEGIDKIETVSDHRLTDFGIKYGFLIEEYRQLARGIIIIDSFDMVRYVELVKEVGDHPNYDLALAVA